MGIILMYMYHLIKRLEKKIFVTLRKTEVSVEKKSVCNVIENLMEHALDSLPFYLYQ